MQLRTQLILEEFWSWDGPPSCPKAGTGPEPLDILTSQSLAMDGPRRGVSLGKAAPHGRGIAGTLSIQYSQELGDGALARKRESEQSPPVSLTDNNRVYLKGLWGLKRFRHAECLGHPC